MLSYGKEGKDSENDMGTTSREYLCPVEIARKSEHIGKTVAETGLSRQAGLFLVSVERPVLEKQSIRVSVAKPSVMSGPASVPEGSASSLTQGKMPTSIMPIPPEGDFSSYISSHFFSSRILMAVL